MARLGVVGVPGGWSSEVLADAVAERTGNRLLFDMRDAVFDTRLGTVVCGDADLCTLDGLILKKLDKVYSPSMLDRLELLTYVASAGVRIYSDPTNMLRLIDRLSCTVELRRAGIPLPPTVVTESVEHAGEAVRQFGRAVLKPLYSTKARGMRMVDTATQPDLEGEIRAFQQEGNPVLYIQQMLELQDRDLGLAFLGGEYIGAYARIRTNDSWNTTTRSGGKYGSSTPSDELIELARRAQAPFELDFTVVDVAETSDGPVVFEVSAFGGFRGLREGAGIEAAALYADYALARLRHD